MHETHYIRNILLSVLALFLVSLVAYWIWTGGIGKLMGEFSAGDPFSLDQQSGPGTGGRFRLPWQPTVGTIPTMQYQNSTETSDLQNQYTTLENSYEQLNAQANQAKVFGDPSPEKGSVLIAEAYGATESDARREYIVLTARTGNTSPVEMRGWSLQSAYTGVRIYLPLSSPSFLMGVLNDQENVLLNPGASAIVNSASSPVGTSFRENICSGYLGQLQNFYPPLSNSCPPSSQALPFTPDNLKVYGDSCFDFLRSVPTCTAPLQNIPPNVTPNCRSFAANVLSYNGCRANNQYRSPFNLDSWRLYLGSNTELWSNTHDIIRLLDSEGRTVDVFTY
jgi:hypothetical protein